MQYLLSLLILFFPSIAKAGIFDPPPSDKSVEFLEQIFGSVGNVLYGESNLTLQAMFDKYNWAIVSIGVIILGYTTIVSIINTAKEGQVMGKKWNSVWIPLRSLLGILLLIPTAGSGYSLIQVTVVWIVIQGVGLADQVWNVILDNLAKGISATSSPRISKTDRMTLEGNAKDLYKSMLLATMCEERIRLIHRGKSADPDINRRNNSNSEMTRVYGDNSIRLHQDKTRSFGYSTTQAGVAADEGSMNLGVPNTKYDKICGSWKIQAEITRDGDGRENANAGRLRGLYYSKLNAIRAIYQGAKTVGRKLAIFGSSHLILDYAKASSSLYQRTIQKYVSRLSGEVRYVRSNDETIQSLTHQGKANGWVVAGSYYFALFKVQQQQLLSSARNGIPYIGSPSSNNSQASSFLKRAELSYLRLGLVPIRDAFIENVGDDVGFGNITFGHDEAAGDNEVLKKILHLFTDIIKKVSDLFFSFLQSDSQAHGDPLVAMASVGQTIMQWAEAAWLAFAALSIISSLLAACAAVNAIFMTLISLLVVVGGIVMAVLMLLFGIGVTLGVYLPMVPYLIFAGAVLGWMMLVIEAVVAGPIIALGMITPSQDELGKVMPAIMILANIFLRPMLMIFGFIFAARLLRAIVAFVSFGFFETAMLILSPTAMQKGPGALLAKGAEGVRGAGDWGAPVREHGSKSGGWGGAIRGSGDWREETGEAYYYAGGEEHGFAKAAGDTQTGLEYAADYTQKGLGYAGEYTQKGLGYAAEGSAYAVSATNAIVTVIFVIVIFSVFVIALTNRVFSLIYVLPDKIMRWIGGQAESVGGEVEKAVGEAKGGFEKGKGSVSKVQAGMASQAQKSAGELGKKLAPKKGGGGKGGGGKGGG